MLPCLSVNSIVSTLLSFVGDDTTTDPDVLRVIGRILRNVSFNAAGRVKLAEDGACAFVSAHMSHPDGAFRTDARRTLANLAMAGEALDRCVDDGIVGALVVWAEEHGAEDQRAVSTALCHLSKPEHLREVVVAKGIIGPLSLLLRSDLEDVKRVCSTALRNLSSNPVVQEQLVAAGAISLLIDVMAVKDELRASSPHAGSHGRISLLPTPAMDWDAGEPAPATSAPIVPAFTEAQVAAEAGAGAGAGAGGGGGDAGIPMASDSKLAEPSTAAADAATAATAATAADAWPDGASDLDNAGGLAYAHTLSNTALHEKLWTKLDVGEMQLSKPVVPTEPDASPSRVRSAGQQSAESKLDTPYSGAVEDDPADDSDDAEFEFGFQHGSPSARFYASQSKPAQQATVMFAPSYARTGSKK